MKKKPNRTRTIEGANNERQRGMEYIAFDRSPSGGKDYYEYDMTQHERCGGGRRIIRKRPGG